MILYLLRLVQSETIMAERGDNEKSLVVGVFTSPDTAKVGAEECCRLFSIENEQYTVTKWIEDHIGRVTNTYVIDGEEFVDPDTYFRISPIVVDQLPPNLGVSHEDCNSWLLLD